MNEVQCGIGAAQSLAADARGFRGEKGGTAARYKHARCRHYLGAGGLVGDVDPGFLGCPAHGRLVKITGRTMMIWSHHQHIVQIP